MRLYLDMAYGFRPLKDHPTIAEFVDNTFPSSARAALILLPTSYLSPEPLYDLLKGFETDLAFSLGGNTFPIEDESTLKTYASRVAGTVAESCIELVYYHTTVPTPDGLRQRIIHAGGLMGIALQYVNIARDVSVDARIGRVYLPTSWLQDEGLKPSNVIRNPDHHKIEGLRQRLLDSAMKIYSEAREAIEQLPPEARGPMRVAVESYMEIGRVLRKPGYRIKAGRATVPKLRRLRVVWSSLNK